MDSECKLDSHGAGCRSAGAPARTTSCAASLTGGPGGGLRPATQGISCTPALKKKSHGFYKRMALKVTQVFLKNKRKGQIYLCYGFFLDQFHFTYNVAGNSVQVVIRDVSHQVVMCPPDEWNNHS